MTGKDAPPEVKIRSYRDSPICDVVVVVHGTEMILRCPGAWNVSHTKFLSPISMLQPKPNPASCHFSCVQIEIELSSARTEADFQAWRDQQEWTARKYAMWQAGEKLPSQKPSTLMKCVCVQQFDSNTASKKR